MILSLPGRLSGRLLPLLALALGALACGGVAADGGPVGTGITASVVGNVAVVEDSLATIEAATADVGSPAASIAGVEVSIDEFSEVAATTDEEGNFALDGAFSGSLTLRFRTPSFEAAQALEVPSGAVVVLSDIELGPGSVDVEAGRQLGFFAEVTSVDCTAGFLLVRDQRRPGDPFTVEILPETAFVRDDAEAACQEIAAGSTIAIEGLLDALGDRAITALVIELDPPARPMPEPIRVVAFYGRIAVRDCDAGVLVIDDGRHRGRAHLVRSTVITDREGNALSCEDIELDDGVIGEGRLDLRRPAVVEALRLVISDSGRPGGTLRIRGFVANTNCTEGVLQVGSGGGTLTVRLLPDTVITPALACAEISVGASVRGTGVPSVGLRGAIDARRLEIGRPASATAR
jgi:hypothetical protein